MYSMKLPLCNTIRSMHIQIYNRDGESDSLVSIYFYGLIFIYLNSLLQPVRTSLEFGKI